MGDLTCAITHFQKNIKIQSKIKIRDELFQKAASDQLALVSLHPEPPELDQVVCFLSLSHLLFSLRSDVIKKVRKHVDP